MKNGGIGLVGVLTTIFVVLKLVGVIDWSWWWVLSPSLFSMGVTFLFLAVAGLMVIAKAK